MHVFRQGQGRCYEASGILGVDALPLRQASSHARGCRTRAARTYICTRVCSDTQHSVFEALKRHNIPRPAKHSSSAHTLITYSSLISKWHHNGVNAMICYLSTSQYNLQMTFANKRPVSGCDTAVTILICSSNVAVPNLECTNASCVHSQASSRALARRRDGWQVTSRDAIDLYITNVCRRRGKLASSS